MGVHRKKLTYVPKKKYPPTDAYLAAHGGRTYSAVARLKNSASPASAVASSHKKKVTDPIKAVIKPVINATKTTSCIPQTCRAPDCSAIFNTTVLPNQKDVGSHSSGGKAGKEKVLPSALPLHAPTKDVAKTFSSTSPSQSSLSEKGNEPLISPALSPSPSLSTLAPAKSTCFPSPLGSPSSCAKNASSYTSEAVPFPTTTTVESKIALPAAPEEKETPPPIRCYSLALCASLTTHRVHPSIPPTRPTCPSVCAASSPLLLSGEVFPYLLENQTRGVFFLQDGSCVQWLPSYETGSDGPPCGDSHDYSSHPSACGAVTSYTVSKESIVMYVNPDGFSFMLPMRSFPSAFFSATGSTDSSSASSRDFMETKDGIEVICVPRVLEDKFRVFFLIWPSPVSTPFSMESKPLLDASPLFELSIFDDEEKKTDTSRSSLLTEWTVLPSPDYMNESDNRNPSNGNSSSSSSISTSLLRALKGSQAAAVSSVFEQKSSDVNPVDALQYELHPQRWVPVSSLDVSLICYPSLPASQGLPCKEKGASTAPRSSCICEKRDEADLSSKTCCMGAWWRSRSTGYFASVHRPISSSTSPSPSYCLQCFLVPYVTRITVKNKLANFCSGLCQETKTSLAAEERKGHNEDERVNNTNSAVSDEVQLVVEMSNYVQPYQHHFFAPHPLEITR